MGLFKRKIKNAFDIARDIGVDEKKVKELVNGEREIRGETMDKVLQSINKSKVERDLEKLNIFQWYQETDLKKMREEFGYEKQAHLSRALKVDNGELNRFENKKFNKVNNFIIKMYDFYHNDFNKNIEKTQDVKFSNKNDITANSKKDITSENKKTAENNVDKEKILDWYLNTDLIKLRGDKPQFEAAKESGIVQGSFSDLELHKITGCSKNVIKLYNYYHQTESENSHNKEIKNFGEVEENKISDEEIWKWYTETEDLRKYGQDFGWSKNKLMSELNLSYDQIRDFEGHHYKSATPIVRKVYEFYHNEENRKKPIEWTPPADKKKEKDKVFTIKNNVNDNITVGSYEGNTSVTKINEPLTGSNDVIGHQIVVPYYHIIEDTPCEDNSSERENEKLKKIIEEQKEKITSLERQIMLYEKLIEKL